MLILAVPGGNFKTGLLSSKLSNGDSIDRYQVIVLAERNIFKIL